MIAALVRGCDGLRVLVTSREPLGIGGEVRYRLPLLSETDAVALFAERARAVRRSFAVDAGNAELVSAIVRRLDGMALAIELAAARLEGAGLETLAAQLDQRFRVLTGGDRGLLPRQRTMRATFDWSYDLLTDAERTLFRRLAIFAGTFTLDAATAICAGDGVAAGDVFDLLVTLVRKSLVVDDGTSEGYTLLESLRAYGHEKLVAAGEATALGRRHAAYYADLAEQAGDAYVGTPTNEWLAAAEHNMPNRPRGARVVARGPQRRSARSALGGRPRALAERGRTGRRRALARSRARSARTGPIRRSKRRYPQAARRTRYARYPPTGCARWANARWRFIARSRSTPTSPTPCACWPKRSTCTFRANARSANEWRKRRSRSRARRAICSRWRTPSRRAR